MQSEQKVAEQGDATDQEAEVVAAGSVTSQKTQQHQSNGANAHPGDAEQLSAVLAEATSSIPEVVSASPIAGAEPGSTTLAIVINASLKRDGKRRQQIAHQIQRVFQDKGLGLVPIVFDEKEVSELDAVDADWRELLSTDSRCEKLRPFFQAKRRFPKDLRRHLMAQIADYLNAIDVFQRESPFPLHMLALFSAEMMDDAIGLLHSSCGLAQRGSETGSVPERFVNSENFRPEDFSLAQRIRGISQQARLFADVAVDTVDLQRQWSAAADEVRSFLRRFKRFVIAELTSESERQYQHMFKRATQAAAAVSVVALFGMYIYSTRSRDPISDKSVITAPGGIKATYFEGMNFERKKFSRTETQINLRAGGSPNPGKIGADLFSVRWDGYIRFHKKGSYELCVLSDDGARLFFNGEKGFDDWSDGPTRKNCTTAHVKPGWFPLKVEYYDNRQLAVAHLHVGEDEDHTQLVPPSDLCCQK